MDTPHDRYFLFTQVPVVVAARLGVSGGGYSSKVGAPIRLAGCEMGKEATRVSQKWHDGTIPAYANK